MSFIQLPVTGAGGDALSKILTDSYMFVGNNADIAVGVEISRQGAMATDGSLTLRGVDDGVAASAGDLGEVDSAEVATATSTGVAASESWGNITSITLAAGAWKLEGLAGLDINTAVDLADGFSVGFSTDANPGSISALDYINWPFLITGSTDIKAPTPVKFVDIAGSTTYYLNTKMKYASGQPQHYGRIVATRIR